MDKNIVKQWNSNCETYVLFDILGKKWTIFIIYLIKHDVNNFNWILKILTRVNPKTLAERLKQLEEIDLIWIKVNEKNARNNYYLTEKGLIVSDKIWSMASSHSDMLIDELKNDLNLKKERGEFNSLN